MDIASLSVVLNQSNVQNQASLSVMKMTMNQSKQTERGMVELLQNSTVQAPHPYAGQHIDLNV
ncbi:YjfB family protein [Bacillus sp. CGMCC 1.16541]|uniref:YjfB family protein n=1 Tax=Bacillus sp. CGMCC 1.16541 TaxID=2185143 RepID=UPI000D72D3F0|nr:YjfB family protein [Bacillus sp. CGMCC 1.16541]